MTDFKRHKMPKSEAAKKLAKRTGLHVGIARALLVGVDPTKLPMTAGKKNRSRWWESD
tara:strand:- start:153 stop:326 length:174 start_codon:yes stop_codon:yes gene_type:complete